MEVFLFGLCQRSERIDEVLSRHTGDSVKGGQCDDTVGAVLQRTEQLVSRQREEIVTLVLEVQLDHPEVRGMPNFHHAQLLVEFEADSFFQEEVVDMAGIGAQGRQFADRVVVVVLDLTGDQLGQISLDEGLCGFHDHDSFSVRT